MLAIDALWNFVTLQLPGWRVQVGRWHDQNGPKTDRFAVIRPAGGIPASLVRRPMFTVTLIGAQNDEVQVPLEAASLVIEAMRASNGELVMQRAGEPSAPRFMQDQRPVCEFPVSTITT